jgi:hypothetical protein
LLLLFKHIKHGRKIAGVKLHLRRPVARHN